MLLLLLLMYTALSALKQMQGDGSFFGITDDFKSKENGYPGVLFCSQLSNNTACPSRLASCWDGVITVNVLL
jgi:hypothetical protein